MDMKIWIWRCAGLLKSLLVDIMMQSNCTYMHSKRLTSREIYRKKRRSWPKLGYFMTFKTFTEYRTHSHTYSHTYSYTVIYTATHTFMCVKSPFFILEYHINVTATFKYYYKMSNRRLRDDLKGACHSLRNKKKS